jgi:hypothetical protein
MSAASGPVALAGSGGANQTLARYFATLNPITTTGANGAINWSRALEEAARRPAGTGDAELRQVALGQGQALDAARRALVATPVPAGLEELHGSVESWLRATVESCEVVYRASSPLGAETFARARALNRAAGVEADRFNRARAAYVETSRTPPRVAGARPGMMASGREMAGLLAGLVLSLGMFAGVVHATNLATAEPTPTAVRAQEVDTSRPRERRLYRVPEVLARLKVEVARRKVAFGEPAVQLVAPDRAIVKGKIQGASSLIPIEVELQMSVTADGQPRVDARRLAAVGVEVPVDAVDALTRRVEEANQTLPDQVPDGFVLRRLYVEGDGVVAELDRLGP